MISDIILIVTGIAGLTFASISDLKTKEIPDWLSYGLISIAIATRTLFAINNNDFFYLIYGLIGLAITFLIGSLMYYTKQWGGGDTKLFAALGAIFATNSYQENFLLSLGINIIVIGSIYAILWSLILAIKQRKKVSQEFKNLSSKRKLAKIFYLVFFTTLIVASIIINDYFIRLLLVVVALLTIMNFYLILIVKSVENTCMHKTIKVKKLVEGDWIAHDIYNNDKLVYNKKSKGINKKTIELLNKLKIKEVTIKEGIPFVPSFLIATILTFKTGNIIIFFINTII